MATWEVRSRTVSPELHDYLITDNGRFVAMKIEHREDALKMAAAPDLLAALIQMASVSQKMDGISTLAWYRALEQANSAIVKAGG